MIERLLFRLTHRHHWWYAGRAEGLGKESCYHHVEECWCGKTRIKLNSKGDSDE